MIYGILKYCSLDAISCDVFREFPTIYAAIPLHDNSLRHVISDMLRHNDEDESLGIASPSPGGDFDLEISLDIHKADYKNVSKRPDIINNRIGSVVNDFD